MCVYNIYKLFTDTQYLLWLCYYCTWLLHKVIVLYMLIAHGYFYWLLYVVFMNSPACLLLGRPVFQSLYSSVHPPPPVRSWTVWWPGGKTIIMYLKKLDYIMSSHIEIYSRQVSLVCFSPHDSVAKCTFNVTKLPWGTTKDFLNLQTGSF